jgi:hypothetical protein
VGSALIDNNKLRSAAVVVIIFECLLFPVLIVMGILAVKRRRPLQDKRIDEYRKSPASRLLKLND